MDSIPWVRCASASQLVTLSDSHTVAEHFCAALVFVVDECCRGCVSVIFFLTPICYPKYQRGIDLAQYREVRWAQKKLTQTQPKFFQPLFR